MALSSLCLADALECQYEKVVGIISLGTFRRYDFCCKINPLFITKRKTLFHAIVVVNFYLITIVL